MVLLNPRSMAYLTSADFTVWSCSGGEYLIPGLILTVTVLASLEMSGFAEARSGVGSVVSVGL